MVTGPELRAAPSGGHPGGPLRATRAADGVCSLVSFLPKHGLEHDGSLAAVGKEKPDSRAWAAARTRDPEPAGPALGVAVGSGPARAGQPESTGLSGEVRGEGTAWSSGSERVPGDTCQMHAALLVSRGVFNGGTTID